MLHLPTEDELNALVDDLRHDKDHPLRNAEFDLSNGDQTKTFLSLSVLTFSPKSVLASFASEGGKLSGPIHGYTPLDSLQELSGHLLLRAGVASGGKAKIRRFKDWSKPEHEVLWVLLQGGVQLICTERGCKGECGVPKASVTVKGYNCTISSPASACGPVLISSNKSEKTLDIGALATQEEVNRLSHAWWY